MHLESGFSVLSNICDTENFNDNNIESLWKIKLNRNLLPILDD